jgi:hypothetical protein
MDASQANASRYDVQSTTGFYESYFQRANHPDRPLAFWIRYTLFSPAGHPADAIGELWAVWFDGETGRHVVGKREVPFAECAFDRTGLAVRVGDAELGPDGLRGGIDDAEARVRWDLAYTGDEPPLLLLPPKLYDRGLPKAKSLVPRPLVRYTGSLLVGDRDVEIDGWVGSQNHNWGTRHTDAYAWGQVAGFDDSPDTFLEVATGKLRFGPVWTPAMTPLVLRHGGKELRLNAIGQTLRAKGEWEYFTWRFRSAVGATAVEGTMTAPASAFVGLRYRNPPGGIKQCLNTKIAACDLTLSHPDGRVESLRTAHRAAFEILTDASDHGIALRA